MPNKLLLFTAYVFRPLSTDAGTNDLQNGSFSTKYNVKLNFKEWLNENAHRTGTKVVNYPPQWDTHPYGYIGVPIFHVNTSADYITWLTLQVKPYDWQGYKAFAGDENKIINTWKQLFLSAPKNYGTGAAATK